MRVVLDTNVLISAGLKQKSMPAMAVLVVEWRDTLLKSIATEEELFAAMERPYLAALIDTRMRDWLKKLMAAAKLVKIIERIAACRDAADDKFSGFIKPKNRKRI
jgi:predicted nucleic acid-binding protein